MAKTKTAAKAAPANNSGPIVLVTSIAAFLALSDTDRTIRFAEKAQVNRTSFSEMGKLHYLITEDIAAWNAANKKKAPRRIYKVLGEMGVSEKSVSNAEYASRIWRNLVVPGHINEAAFDSLTFQDCYAIARVVGEKSACRLDGSQVAELMKNQPADFDDELRSLFEHGVTVDEKKAQDDKAESDRVQALVTAQAKAAAAATPPASAATAPAATTAAPTSTDAAPTNETPAAETEQPAPTNVTAMPPQAKPDANLAAMLDVLGEIASESAAFTPEGQQALLAKLDETRAAIAARIEEAVAA